MGCVQVLLQAWPSLERLFAQVAVDAARRVMGAFVHPAMAARNERLLANGTRVRSFTCKQKLDKSHNGSALARNSSERQREQRLGAVPVCVRR